MLSKVSYGPGHVYGMAYLVDGLVSLLTAFNVHPEK